MTHASSRSTQTPIRPVVLTGLPARPSVLRHSTLHTGSPQRCCQFHRDRIDGLVVERDPRCSFQLPSKPFLLRRLNPMLEPQHSRELCAKCTTHHLRERFIWFERASFVRDLVVLLIASPHCSRTAAPETPPSPSDSSSFAAPNRLKCPSPDRTTPILLCSNEIVN